MSILHVDTKKPAEKVLEDLPKVCAAHQFGVLGSLDLRATLRSKGKTYDRVVVVFDVCHPGHAQRALEADPSVSTMLPCRISLFERPDGTLRLATMRPTTMIGIVGNPALDTIAREVEQAMDAILHDAAR